MHDPQSLLRHSLRGNAAFSALSGLVLLAGAGALGPVIGVDAPLLAGVGVGLLGFAGFLVWASSRPRLDPTLAMQVVWADLAWVIGTAALVLLDALTRTGALAAVAVADVVLLFALLQYLGIRRVRSGGTARRAAA